jgi:hypothetical protein
MFAGVAIGAGTDAVAGDMAGGGCSTASTRRHRLRVVFAGIRLRCVTGRERQVPRPALPRRRSGGCCSRMGRSGSVTRGASCSGPNDWRMGPALSGNGNGPGGFGRRARRRSRVAAGCQPRGTLTVAEVVHLPNASGPPARWPGSMWWERRRPDSNRGWRFCRSRRAFAGLCVLF